jgi:F-type H+-transporting ATPase subunit b
VLLDWFTVVAQIINFLILVALLKYFLYGRIVRAMEERERIIAMRLEEAAAQRESAEQEAETYRRQREELEAKRNELFSQAKAEADERRISLEHKAREEVEHLRARWQETLQEEADAFLQKLRERSAAQVCAIARRALHDLATVDLETQMVDLFLEHLQNVDEERVTTLRNAIRAGGNTLVVRSAFDLPEKLHRKVTHVLRERLADGAEVEFKTVPAMGCGISVEAHGQKIVWGVDHYMDALEHHVAMLLAEKIRRPLDEHAEPAEPPVVEETAWHEPLIPAETLEETHESALPHAADRSG